MSVDQNIMCPRCGTFQKKAETCSECGVVIEKVSPNQNAVEANINKVILRGRKTKDSDPLGWFRATRAVLWVLGLSIVIMFYIGFFKNTFNSAKHIMESKVVSSSSDAMRQKNQHNNR